MQNVLRTRLRGTAAALFAFALTLGFAAAVPGTGHAEALTYKIDHAHSYVGFSVTHMMMSQVKGEFGEFDGTITYDPKDLSTASASGTVEVASINTRNEKRDKHLRSDDFFHAEKHPQIKYELNKLEKKGDGLVAHGELTIRGTTKKVAIPVEVRGPITDPYGMQRIGLNGELTIDRKEYGLNWSKTLDNGGAVVSDEVDIDLQVEAVHKPGK